VHRLICEQEQNCCPHIATLRSATPPATWPAATTTTLSLTVRMVLLTPRACPTSRVGIQAASPVFKLPYWTSNFVTHDLSPFTKDTIKIYRDTVILQARRKAVLSWGGRMRPESGRDNPIWNRPESLMVDALPIKERRPHE
jgi:hypothetical protein